MEVRAEGLTEEIAQKPVPERRNAELAKELAEELEAELAKELEESAPRNPPRGS